MPPEPPTEQALRAENAELRARLEDAEETLRAIRAGEVDALVVESAAGPQCFTLPGLDAEQNRFRGEILAQVGDAVIATDADERITYLNAAAERQYRVRASDALGRNLAEIYTRHWPSPEAEARMWAALRERGEWRGELSQRTYDGQELHVEATVTTLHALGGAPIGYVAAIRDISERQRTDATLRESEERMRRAEQAARSGTWDWSFQSGEASWSKSAWAVFGRTPGEFTVSFHTWLACVHPEDRADAAAAIEAARGAGLYRAQYRVLDPDGTVRWVESRGEFIFDDRGQPVRLLGTVLDITARKQAEDAQRRSEEFARGQWAEAEAALEAVPANIAILDAAGVIVRVNNGWTSFASRNGLAPGSVAVGVNYLAVCDAVTGPEAGQAKAFAAGIRSVIGGKSDRFSMEYPCHSPEEQRWFMGYVTITLGPGPARAVVAHVDISALKRTDEQIRILNAQLESRVAERTAELRTTVEALETQIAEGRRLKAEVLRVSEEERLRVAADLHDGICQELVGIQLFAHTLRDKLEKAGHPLAAEARRIQEAMAGTTDHTRQVARGMNPVVADGSGLMHALRQLAETTARSRRVHCSFHCPVPVPIDDPKLANELYRIAQEAIYNAIRHGQAKRITVRLSASGGAGRLAVRDNGSGLPADHSRAPGMGLRVMRYRAGVIGGQLVVQPRRGGGTEVICRFSQSSDRP